MRINRDNDALSHVYVFAVVSETLASRMNKSLNHSLGVSAIGVSNNVAVASGFRAPQCEHENLCDSFDSFLSSDCEQNCHSCEKCVLEFFYAN